MAEDGGGALGGASVFIKRVKKVEAGAHGGAWKIAYADFVTAMMAFFLLLWLLNSVTQEQLEGISNYFAPASASATKSGAGGVLGGQTVGEEGAQSSASSKPSVTLDLPPPKSGLGGEDSAETQQSEAEAAAAEAAEEVAKRLEEEENEKVKKEINDALSEIPNGEELKKSLVIENTPEGLRILIIDREGLPMFQSGGAEPLERARNLLGLVANVIKKMSQKISISGHTDSLKFGVGSAYTNWELSVDRANAARRVLRDAGLAVSRLSQVVGKADTEPFIKDDPANPRNRRLSIVLLREPRKIPTEDKETPPETIPP